MKVFLSDWWFGLMVRLGIYRVCPGCELCSWDPALSAWEDVS